MYCHQDPIINNWYTNLTGKLFKVRMALYIDANVNQLVIEYIDGTRQIISREEWDCLKLLSHNNRIKQKQKKQRLKNQEELTH